MLILPPMAPMAPLDARRRIFGPGCIPLLHPGARLHPRIHCIFPGSLAGFSAVAHLFRGIHDAAHGRGDSIGSAIAIDVGAGFQLDIAC